ncbi:carbonic anhydrase-related protein 10-like isoform X1 [Schistocerca piceifrons]|uniref:carbonic anhydrase-related protein 10-like isoform X1 n=1 Tax=Schistocerca piceifrons TaxID=274613 RepID=UPI001F5E85CA|nr:carbonic anhydrase-related protein 10-like isoform X1 [Schistocerca piceifrons]
MGWCAAWGPLAALLLLVCAHGTWASWEEWWTYDGISGPAFWGLINPQWSLCSKGRRQSPIDIEPDKLLFDPLLRPLHIDKNMVSGTLHNTGQTLVFRVSKDAKEQPVNITGGPLAYRYQFEEMYFHYGTNNSHGSEHRIHGYSFPGEIQLYGFNADLYHNMTEAQHKSQGIVGVSVMLQVSESPTTELRIITSTFGHIRFKASSTPIRPLTLQQLLPRTDHYMTYEGSTTHPGCWETTVWVVLNKPIYISRHEMYSMRRLMQGPFTEQKAPLANNVRPLQHLHHRTVRTNIDFFRRKGKKCPTMHRDMRYIANTWRDLKQQD